jgi:hypothetical protein
MAMLPAPLLLLGLFLKLSALPAVAQEFGTYRNARHGFSLSYPAGTFSELPPPASAEGQIV